MVLKWSYDTRILTQQTDKTAYVVGDKFLAYDIPSGKWSDKIKVQKGRQDMCIITEINHFVGPSVSGRVFAWGSSELVFDTRRQLPPKTYSLNILNLGKSDQTYSVF